MPPRTPSDRELWDALRQHERNRDDGGHADHEDRIRSLEFRFYAILGVIAAAVAGAGWLRVGGLP